MADPIIKAIVDLKEDEAIALVQGEIQTGTEALKILTRCQEGMTAVGELFEKKEYYLSELIFSASIFKKLSALIEEAMSNQGASQQQPKGAVVIGTTAGDMHDLGKNIVTTLLKASGYEVIDLGMDVPPDHFIEKVRESGAKVLAISALLTTSFAGIKKVVELLESADLRNATKVMIGGGVVNESSRQYVGADMQSQSAYEAVKYCDEVYISSM
jgi:5-methyltetrahydrofolate--homocysteine methyltransferase